MFLFGPGKSGKTGTKQSATFFFYTGPVSTHIPLIWNHFTEYDALFYWWGEEKKSTSSKYKISCSVSSMQLFFGFWFGKWLFPEYLLTQIVSLSKDCVAVSIQTTQWTIYLYLKCDVALRTHFFLFLPVVIFATQQQGWAHAEIINSKPLITMWVTQEIVHQRQKRKSLPVIEV